MIKTCERSRSQSMCSKHLYGFCSGTVFLRHNFNILFFNILICKYKRSTVRVTVIQNEEGCSIHRMWNNVTSFQFKGIKTGNTTATGRFMTPPHGKEHTCGLLIWWKITHHMWHERVTHLLHLRFIIAKITDHRPYVFVSDKPLNGA